MKQSYIRTHARLPHPYMHSHTCCLLNISYFHKIQRKKSNLRLAWKFHYLILCLQEVQKLTCLRNRDYFFHWSRQEIYRKKNMWFHEISFAMIQVKHEHAEQILLDISFLCFIFWHTGICPDSKIFYSKSDWEHNCIACILVHDIPTTYPWQHNYQEFFSIQNGHVHNTFLYWDL